MTDINYSPRVNKMGLKKSRVVRFTKRANGKSASRNIRMFHLSFKLINVDVLNNASGSFLTTEQLEIHTKLVIISVRYLGQCVLGSH